jgi:sugar/nucleoside kinase (ribokinase family)
LTYGIGNPLIDVVIRVTDHELASLGINKGIMHLVSEADQARILGALEGKSRTYLPGGSAPNTMLALAGMGVDAVISGKIGDDEFGRTYGAQVAAYGIESRLAHGDGATGSCVILVTPDGERSMNTHLGMCQEFSRADLDEGLLARADYLSFTGYMWDMEVQKDAITRAIELARPAGAKVVFDVADPFAVERYREDFLELIREHVDVVFANRREAGILFGEQADDRPARLLVEHVEIGVLKTGKDGSITATDGELIRTPGTTWRWWTPPVRATCSPRGFSQAWPWGRALRRPVS